MNNNQFKNNDLEKITKLLKKAKNRKNFNQALENMRDLAIKINATENKVLGECQQCQLLDTIYKKAWEIAKMKFHTFKYQCQECGMNWISAFYQVKD